MVKRTGCRPLRGSGSVAIGPTPALERLPVAEAEIVVLEQDQIRPAVEVSVPVQPGEVSIGTFQHACPDPARVDGHRKAVAISGTNRHDDLDGPGLGQPGHPRDRSGRADRVSGGSPRTFDPRVGNRLVERLGLFSSAMITPSPRLFSVAHLVPNSTTRSTYTWDSPTRNPEDDPAGRLSRPACEDDPSPPRIESARTRARRSARRVRRRWPGHRRSGTRRIEGRISALASGRDALPCR